LKKESETKGAHAGHRSTQIRMSYHPPEEIPEERAVNLLSGAAWLYNWATLWKARRLEPEKFAVFAIARQIKKEVHFLLTYPECYQLYTAVRATQSIPGELAELGVYRGGSARLISHANTARKPLHLFDLFGDFPKPRAGEDQPGLAEGIISTDLERVRRYLSSCPEVVYHVGMFPGSAQESGGTLWSFVHLDCDLYDSTLQGLEFFYPRLNAGGVLLSHDYQFSGVRKAFDQYMKDKPEPLLTFAGGSQVLFVKLKHGV
jgi:O-methyltransferase